MKNGRARRIPTTTAQPVSAELSSIGQSGNEHGPMGMGIRAYRRGFRFLNWGGRAISRRTGLLIQCVWQISAKMPL